MESNSNSNWNIFYCLVWVCIVMQLDSNYVFCFRRCLVRDKEVACREKDSEIRDLKEKVVTLTSYLRKSEIQKAELLHQVKSQVSFWLTDSPYYRF